METFQGRNGSLYMRPMGFGCAKAGSSYAQVDAIVSSVNRMGVFADVGPLPVFVSNQVCVYYVQSRRNEVQEH